MRGVQLVAAGVAIRIGVAIDIVVANDPARVAVLIGICVDELIANRPGGVAMLVGVRIDELIADQARGVSVLVGIGIKDLTVISDAKAVAVGVTSDLGRGHEGQRHDRRKEN